VFERTLEFAIEESSQEEFEALSETECLDLAEDLDKTLEEERVRVKPVSGAVVPMPFSVWFDHDFADDQAVMRLTLLNPQIVVPMPSILDATFLGGHYLRRRLLRDQFQNLHDWTQRHASLIRSGAILPRSYEIYHTNAVDRLCTRAANSVNISHLVGKETEFAPVIKVKSKEESLELIRNSCHLLFEELFIARKLNCIPAFADPWLFRTWNELAPKRLPKQLFKEQCDVSRTLLELKLPNLWKLSPEDIISLRGNSEAFAFWRERVAVVLRNTRRRVTEGSLIESALKEEAWPLTDAVNQIEKEMGAVSLKGKIKKTASTVGIGAASILATAGVLAYLRQDPALVRELIKLGTAGALGAASTLWYLFFGPPRQDKDIIVKFYNALFR
jgi:hypothetical protein